MYRGSRKHVLDWTGCSSFLEDLGSLLGEVPVDLSDAVFMPCGLGAPNEARLEHFGPTRWPDEARDTLRDWWLCHKAGANTPNWDIAVSCRIEGQPGLILVEAKANWPEFGYAGKPLSTNASTRSVENHERIGSAIKEACTGWKQIDSRVCISRDSHYQLANRLAFAWKLASLEVPVVLVYLGFTGDLGIEDVGPRFIDDANWQAALKSYTEGVVPLDLFDQRLMVGSTPLWLLSRSRDVTEFSQPRV